MLPTINIISTIKYTLNINVIPVTDHFLNSTQKTNVINQRLFDLTSGFRLRTKWLPEGIPIYGVDSALREALVQKDACPWTLLV